ncbi:hypothetical protein CJF42_05590 [Pseudoalteromonas sp. NBT06-2]|uniref:hypothetical protein n=1 Tax=Pseudoalteromonas sp. NBT06-2 TaxID=2025950 RepID=UPI000BA77DD7|nr:hypothetical protein [Pseudoalteromonas sp. NBT06-2]PAJ75317.1 hypothetical protein CJF42_05590 [Pseudoalteromonas sp. NBT06-2]
MPVINIFTIKYLTHITLFILLSYSSWVNSNPQIKEQKSKQQIETSKKKKDSVDQWSDWNNSPLVYPKYGVGIQGYIENKLNQLDKSNLLDNTNGVLAKKNNKKKVIDKMKKPKNIKKMMAELKAMEADLKQELSHESEF